MVFSWHLAPQPPSTRGVSFHYNDSIMNFGVCLQSIFPPSWIDLVLVLVVDDFYDHLSGFLP